MSKKKELDALHKDMREHPEKYDYGDIPEGRKIVPAQEKALDDSRPEWLKKMLAENGSTK